MVVVRKFLAIPFLVFTLACHSNWSAQQTLAKSPTVDQQNRPNVVLILIDDLNHYGVTAYGANRIRSWDGRFEDQEFSTPSIDRLAREGLRFDRAFANPICENTRIALMSGMNNDRNYLRPKSQHASDITFGDTFQRAGYATGLFGKWKQTRGTREIPGKRYISEFGWDEYTAYDVVTEGQRFINPNLVVNGKIQNYEGRTDVDPQTGRRWYGPDIVNRDALKFIEKHRDEPFFLYYSMLLVHDDHKPTPDTLPHSVFDEFDEANHNREGHTGDDRKYFPDMLAYMDKLIGKVVAKLETEGLREKTLIVVIGDNGTKESFAHILPDGTIYPGRKGGNADNGIHVPLVMSLPGTIPVGENGDQRAYDGLVNITDIYPTIAEAAGVEIPNAEDLDGISVWPQATGAAGEPRETIYQWFIGNETYHDEDIILRYVFNKNFKRYAPSKHFPKGRFFDLRNDLLEREGDRHVELRWQIKRYSGLDISKLPLKQKQAYDELGEILRAKELKRVERLEILAEKKQVAVGESLTLRPLVYPPEARRRGVVWESSDPSVLTVDKFGVVKARKAGKAEVAIYSWDDAEPLSNNSRQTYRRDGLKAVHKIVVR